MRRNNHKGAERARQAAAKPPYLQGVIWFMSECIRNAAFPGITACGWRCWPWPPATNPWAGLSGSANGAARKFFVELPGKAASAGEIDASLDLEAVSIWLFALGDGLIARSADDLDMIFVKIWKYLKPWSAGL